VIILAYIPTATGISISNANDLILRFKGHFDTILNNANNKGCNILYKFVTSTLLLQALPLLRAYETG